MLVSFLYECLGALPGWGDALPWLLYALALLLMVVGVVGCVMPYPGHLFLLGGCVLWAYTSGEPYPSALLWVALALLAVLGCFLDTIFSLVGAKKFGCSRAAFWCSAVGALVGLFFFPLGLFIGPFLGAVIGELWLEGRSLKESLKSGAGALIGALVGMAAKFVVAGVMLFLFFI